MVEKKFVEDTKNLIDNLKAVCAAYGLGNDGNEYKIILQSFLYKFMNDKFAAEVKKKDAKLANSEKWEQQLATYSNEAYEKLLLKLDAGRPRLKREHLLTYLANKQNQPDFSKLFDDTLRDIAVLNNEIFAVKTETGAKIKLFDEISQFISDTSKRDDFCRAIINKLLNFNFETIFDQGSDFFATIFEYLIKDYNKDGGGKYAEYYTPKAVSKIMASILVNEPVSDVSCYDPSAGSGTLLMSLAHSIGQDKCSVFSQDISQKSSTMLRLNLVLNNLVHSIPNIVQGNTLDSPFHKDGESLMKFDYIVSNPPFKLDFSDFRENLDSKQHKPRFFAGIPKVPAKKKESMAIYLLFIQHIMHSLAPAGKAAVVVPTGFLTAQSGIEKKIRQKLVEERMLRGVVSMPSNIFATTGTNVSVLFIDKANKKGDIVLMDASKLGTTVKEGKNQKTLLSPEEEQKVIETFNSHKAVEDFSIVVSYEQIAEKNYSFSAGQYFEVKIEYKKISPEEFSNKIKTYKENLEILFCKSHELEADIVKNLEGLKIE